MTKRLFREWPLAAFTLAIQFACGIAIATTITVATHSHLTAASRFLGISVFPTVALGLLLSLLHLGRPLSAWRALSNALRSRLSLEVLLTTAFAVSAFVYSYAWMINVSALRLATGLTTSLFGFAAVIASAAIYRIPARPVWNSTWVESSFVGSTIIVSGLAISFLSSSSLATTIPVLLGSTLLLFSAAWMWLKSSHLLQQTNWLPFATHLLLIAFVPLLLLTLPTSSNASVCVAALAIITGRLLMFALAELEPRF